MQLYKIIDTEEGEIDHNLTWEEAQSFYGAEPDCQIIEQ